MSLFSTIRDGKTALNEAIMTSGCFNEVSGETLRSLQNVLLEMYIDLKSVCDKYGCKAYLCGGSALGCVRHSGFIPWDDDLDVAMSRNDYNKLKLFFEDELGSKYLLNAPNYSKNPIARFPKILKKNTKLVGLGNEYEEDKSLVFLDIFIIDNIPDNILLRGAKGLWVNFLEAAAAQIEYTMHWGNMKKIYKNAGYGYAYTKLIAGTLFSAIPYSNWLKAIDRAAQYNNENSKYCGLITGRKHYFGEILPREVFYLGSVGEFEGNRVDVFQEIETYLINLYGNDYMTLPPEEKREHHYVSELEL